MTNECAVKRKCNRSLLEGVSVGKRGALALRVRRKSVRTTFSTMATRQRGRVLQGSKNIPRIRRRLNANMRWYLERIAGVIKTSSGGGGW